jgi:hypothetical protein
VTQQDEWHADGDREFSMLAPLQSSNTPGGTSEVIESQCDFFQESIAGRRWSYSRMPPLKELCADTILQAADAPTHCRLLNVQRGGCTAKAAMLRRREGVLEQPEIRDNGRHARPPSYIRRLLRA